MDQGFKIAVTCREEVPHHNSTTTFSNSTSLSSNSIIPKQNFGRRFEAPTNEEPQDLFFQQQKISKNYFFLYVEFSTFVLTNKKTSMKKSISLIKQNSEFSIAVSFVILVAILITYNIFRYGILGSSCFEF